MKDFFQKNKSIFQKIGIGIISLVIVIMVCLSPNILKNLKGNVLSVDFLTRQSSKNEVFVETSLQNNGNDIELNVYNYENKDITISKIEYRDICNINKKTCLDFAEFDISPVTISSNTSKVINLSNVKDKVGKKLNLELGIRYTLNEKDYVVTTNTFSTIKFDPNARNTENNEKTEEEFIFYPKGKASDFENNNSLFESAKITVKLTDNNVHMETNENLSDLNLKYKMSSRYLYAWYLENPFKETTYKAKMLGLDNYSNFRDYFDYSYPSDTKTGTNGFDFSFDIPGSKPKTTVTNQTVFPTFFWFLGAKNAFGAWKWKHTSENENIYASNKIPQFKLTIYNKENLKTAIENALEKLVNKKSLYFNNESYFELYNKIENAKRLYSGRNYYNMCDITGDNCVKTDVNQEQIDSYITFLNNYTIKVNDYSNYVEYNSLISKINKLDSKIYEAESYNNMMNIYNEKNKYLGMLSSYQIRVDNYVEKLQKAYDNLVMLGADYTEVDKIIDKANKISNIVNDGDELYTKDSWNNLQNTIKNVDKTLKIDQQSKVDNYVVLIQTAIDGLTKNPAKYTEIEKIINDYRNNPNYTNGYWTNESKKIVDDFILTKPLNKKIDEQSLINDWVENLKKLINNKLEFINAKGYVDSDNYHPTDLPSSLSIEGYLNYFKAEINKKINNINLYTDDTIIKLTNIINDYYDSEGKWKSDLVFIKINNQSEMDKLIKDMDNIKNTNLIKNPADYTKLKKVQQVANNLVRDNYKDLTELDDKLRNANELSDKLKIDDQDKIDKAATELEIAISNLVLKDANYEKLNAAITKAENIVRENYKDLTELDAKLKTAKASLNLKIDKQKEVDKAAVELETAITNLVLKDANYEKLNVAITKAENIVRENYKDLTDLDAKLKTAKASLNLKIDKQKDADKAAAELETAITNLVLKDANYEKLNVAITKADNIVRENYKDLTDLDAKLKTAKASLNLKIDKQKDVDKAAAELETAITNLVLKDANYAKLNVAITKAENLVRENYKDLTDLDAKLKNAKNVLNLKIDKQKEVDKAAAELETAISNLVLKDANYEKVNAAITKAENLFRENYKDLTDLDAKLKNAKNVLNLKIDKQKEVDKAAAELETAISNLVLKDANYTELNKAIEKANNLVRDNYKDLTNLDAKLKTAKASLNLKIDKQKEVDKAAAELEDAITNLVLKDANYEKVNAAITKAENIVRENYKDLTELDAKLKTAKASLNLKIDKQKEVDKAAVELETAISNLVLKDANYTELNKAIEKANNLVRDNYKDLTNLDAKLKTAKASLNLKIDKQKEVDKAAVELETAITNLVLKDANYEKLNAAITKAENIVRENYKDLTDLDAKLKTAKASLNLKIDKQKEVDKAAVELVTAISNLELKGADYSKINDFKTNVYDKLDSTKYTNFDTLVNAMNNIDYSIKINEQEKVNEIYNSLVKVYNNLIKTRADYSKVELAINNAKKYEANKYNYTNYDEVEKLINSIDYNLDWGSQDKVDKYATDINYAISNLNKGLADYSKLAKVLSKLPADYSKYSSDIQREIKEYLDEVKDLSTDLRYDEQDIIDEIVKRGNILLDKLSKIKDYDDSIKEDIKNDEKTTTTKKVTTIKKNSTRKNSSNKSKTTVKTTDSSKNNNEKVIKYIKINDEKIEFTDNKINLNVDFSVEKADVVVKLQNDEDKYEVYGGEVLMPGINTVTIIVTRKNGTTYRYDINIKRPETSNYLSSVEIKNSSIKFDKNKNNYTINVDKDTNKLDLIAKLEDKNATMKITGNSNLKNGSKVEIKVTDTKGNTNTYVITVKKSDARYIKIIIIIVALLSALTVGYKLVQNKKRN